MSERKKWIACGLLILTAFSFRFWIARSLPNDTPGDSRVYTQMARNLLEHHVYSHAAQPPFPPSFIRLPGYPIFLAAVYSVFGHGNNNAVRVVQALLDTLTCILVALLAWYWEPDEKRKPAAGIAALALAAVCPFTTIYVGTILTETWASLFTVVLCLLATLGLRAGNLKQSLSWWALAGLIGGLSVFFRPDSGLAVAALGLTLTIVGLRGRNPESGSLRGRLLATIAQGSVLTLAFVLVLVPWTLRNWRVFHVFQPLAPTHGQMPGEFVPLGYYAWVRTWVDDRKYTEPMLWSLDEAEIDVDELPASAFDSAEEKARVVELIDQYNDPQDHEPTEAPADPGQTSAPVGASATPPPATESEEGSAPGKGVTSGQNNNQATEEQAQDEPPPEMTPALDAKFGEIARERIARAPLRHYLWLPLKRARSLWFGPHADYYPFSGELFPLDDLDYSIHQQFWLPLFEVLVWIFTLLGVAGGWVLWRSRDAFAQQWLLLTFLVIFIRLAYFSTMENPEPRYTVEIFPLLAILGGIFVARLTGVRKSENAI